MDTQNVETLKIICFRIYATNNYFYDPDDSSKIKPLSPIIIQDYPEIDWKFTCFFGEVPDNIKTLHYLIKGYALFSFQMLGLGNYVDNTKTRKEQIEECILKGKSGSTVFTDYKWYTVEVLEKDIDVLNCDIFDIDHDTEKKNLAKISNSIDNVSSKKLMQFLTTEIKNKQFSVLFDKITLCLTSEIPNYFFRKLVDSGCVLIMNGTMPLILPKFEMTGDLCVAKKYQNLNQEKISLLIKQKGAIQNKSLNSISYLYLAMMREEDKWKKFLLGFVCLEIITLKIFKKINLDNRYIVHLKNGEGNNKSVDIPIFDVIHMDTNRMPLVAKFSFIAGILNPEKYSDDRLIFIKCKEARDKMGHDTITTDKLPLSELQTLLDYYIEKMVITF